jgi:two-component system response regulator MprA
VVTRRALIESLWGLERDVEANTLDAFVRLLRQKIDQPGAPALINTVRGVGYRLGDEGALR